ncbi:hypothetical protein [Paenibacillus phytorum]|nr:hypothetical protein [Paenibacillus phytorum]
MDSETEKSMRLHPSRNDAPLFEENSAKMGMPRNVGALFVGKPCD